MQRRLRLLPFALSAGVVAVIAAALPLFASVPPPPTQIQYTRVTKVVLPGMMSMFLGGNKGTSERTTVSASRQRIDKENESDIVQCDLKRFVHLDNGAKTYYTMTFEQAKAAMQAAEQQMMQRMGSVPSPAAQASAPAIQGSGGITITSNIVNDQNTQQIFGMTAHHMTETFTGTSSGTGQCPNASMTMTNDEWYVPNQVTFSCPLPRPSIPAMQMPNMPHGGGGARNPCLGYFQVQASGKAHHEDRFALKQDTTIDLGFKMTTHEEVTQYQVQPYDPSFFDVPAGYSQVQPPANGPYGGGH